MSGIHIRVGSWVVALLLALTPSAQAGGRGDLLFHRGVAAYGAGDLATARVSFRAALEESPGDAGALRYLGLIARQQGEIDRAVENFQAAIAAAPQEADAYIALAETLLDAGRNEEARAAIEPALAFAPAQARVQLCAGIADYRLGHAGAAIDHLERAGQLDPSLQRQAAYYRGLSQAVLGNLYAASGALGEVGDASPGHLLGESARSLREQIQPQLAERIWFLSTTAGVEYDSNPTVASELLDPSADLAGSFQLRGLVDAYRGGGFTFRAGYDGYLAVFAKNDLVDEQTHIAKALMLYDYRDARFSVAYDYAFSMLDLTQKFRGLHSLEPAVSLRVGRWGVTQVFYQFLDYEYFLSSVLNPALDRDGTQHSVGASQVFALPQPLSYARVGALYTDRDTTGSEFAYSGFEVNGGAGLLLPLFGHDLGVSALYRYARLGYKNPSIFPTKAGTRPPAPGQGVERTENVHDVSIDLSLPVWRRLTLAVSGGLIFVSSEIDALNYDRKVVGTYLTWDF